MNANKKLKTAITPTRSENYPEWYQQVIKAADLAENAPVRGCMIIKPWGYALWENMQAVLDHEFKITQHKNAYFPLFIPLSFMQKEADHIEGFAKECAVVTHHRLAKDGDGKLIPASPLEEPYIVRPTSETIIGDSFSRWVQSYRDLPLLINQWANIVRWEMRTRLFLRTTEFLWQEGHTAHATADDAMREVMLILNIYADFAENYLAIPVIKGEKTASERFPGADSTFCIEAMMQDKKALQCATSHFLGQHFSKSFNIQFSNQDGLQEFAWTTSWGSTTRLIGGLIMVHSDDDGFILPPKIAPLHIVILPILHKVENKEDILQFCDNLREQLQSISYHGAPLKVEIDQRDIAGGEKAWSWVKKGVPIRIEVGKKELAQAQVFVGLRTAAYNDKTALAVDDFLTNVCSQLDEMQALLLQRARAYREQNTEVINSKQAFYDYFNNDGGFALAHFNGDPKIEEQIKKDLSVTVRCIPITDIGDGPGHCIFSGELSAKRVVFAKAY
jgi:prolyl-tRNA synthetase